MRNCRRARSGDARRASGEFTVPTTIALERATNPFLRADDAGVQAAIGMSGAPFHEAFAEIRRRKDQF